MLKGVRALIKNPFFCNMGENDKKRKNVILVSI